MWSAANGESPNGGMLLSKFSDSKQAFFGAVTNCQPKIARLGSARLEKLLAYSCLSSSSIAEAKFLGANFVDSEYGSFIFI